MAIGICAVLLWGLRPESGQAAETRDALFNYLANREELEHSLEPDIDDPLPEGCYRATTQARWNTPEFIADTVQKINILQTTQHMWKGNAPKWRIDMQATCDAKVEHFEKLTVILARHGQQSTQEMMRAAVESKALPLFKAIQDITCQAANIPLTQATKWACDSWASRSTYLMVHCQSSSLQTLQIYTHR